VRWQISKAKQVRRSKFPVTGPPRSCQFDEAQCAHLTETASDIVAIGNPVVLEIVKGHRQLAVVVSAVRGQLNLDASQYPVPGEAQHAKGR